MRWSELPLNPTRRMLRQFAVAWLIFFTALALYWWLRRESPQAGAILSVVASIGLPGIAWPRAMRWLFIVATVAAFPIGWLVTQVTLAFMFYVVLTPIGLWLRWRGRDELHLQPRAADTFWGERGPAPAAENYLKQY